MKNFLSLLAAALIAGCAATTPIRQVAPVVKPLRLADEATVEARISRLRALLEPLAVRAILCYPRAVLRSDIPLDLVFENIKKLGFNRICALISSEKELDGDLEDFLDAAHRFEIPVELMLAERDFFVRERGNRLLRKVRSRTPELIEVVQLAIRFNESLPEENRIAGLTVILEPHKLVLGSPYLPPDALFSWNEKTYGPGLDNDQIMLKLFELLRQLPGITGEVPVSVAVPDFIHEKALAGELTVGTIADFCAITGIRRVVVINSGNRPSQLLSGVSNELKEAPAGAKIVVAIPVAGHSSVGSGALRRRDWRDFMRALGYLIRNAGCYSSFDGVVVGPLAYLQFILTEKD